MTNLIDTYLLKSGMPAEELCIIGRAKRAFYYYGMLIMAAVSLGFLSAGLFKIIG